MLREYRLANFKAFGETVTIPIRPLTLIFGANSSGKSSIFQSLLMLKQTLEEAKNPATVLLPKGSLVDLGTYSDFVHRHEINRDFEVGARFKLKNPLTLSSQETVSEAGLDIRFFCPKEQKIALLSRGKVTLGGEQRPIASYPLDKILEGKSEIRFHYETEFWKIWWNALHCCYDMPSSQFAITRSSTGDGDKRHNIGSSPQYKDQYKALAFLISKNFEISGHDAEEWAKESIVKDGRRAENSQDFDSISGEKLDEWVPEMMDVEVYQYRNFLPYDPFKYGSRTFLPTADKTILYKWISFPVMQSCSSFRAVLEDLVYLGPLRSQPEHYYHEYSGDVSEYVGQRGDDLPSILFKKQDVLERANDDLKRLGIGYRLETSPLQHEDRSLSSFFSLLLIDTRTKIDASLRDVGFGISQVLPVVVQSRLSENKTLLIEQPEVHLHPAHQAELGDLFIRSAKEQGNTLLLETHSEHLLLRIMRRMRETSTGTLPEGAIAVRPEDVMVLFVESDGSQSIVREMPLDERGELVKAWPGGFFEEGLREIL